MNKAGMFLVALMLPVVAFGQNLVEKKNFTGTDLKKIVLTTSGGDIQFESWEKNEVEVSLFLTDKSDKRLKEFNEKYERTYRMENGVVYVEVKQKSKSKWNFWLNFSGLGHRFKVYIPQAFAVQAKTSGGDVRVEGIKGVVTASTSGGDIHLQDISGIISISTSGGDIELDEISGSLEASTSGGDISGNKLAGKVEVSTSGGDVDLSGDYGQFEASTSGGSIEVSLSSKCDGLDLSTSGGDIRITVPRLTAADLELKTSGGGVRLAEAIEENFSGKIKKDKVTGKMNGGGVQISAGTSGGSIRMDVR